MPDTTPPTIIAGPTVTSITDTTALIQWQTSEPAQGGVKYGTSNPPDTARNENSHATTHSQALSGLSPDTTYYVTVFGSDKAGNPLAAGTAVVFRTAPIPDTAAPVIIEGPTVTAITHLGATVTWKTNEPSSGTVAYGTTDAFGQTVIDSALSTSHSVTLSGLAAETLHSLQIGAIDAVGNGPTTSPTVSFRTIAVPDTASPVIVEGPMATNITDTGATIVWTTDEPSTSGVSWNDGTAYGVYTDETLTTSHSVQISGLTATTTYTYVVSSKDAFANGPTLSPAKSFATLPTPDTMSPVFTEGPLVINTTHQSAVIRWKSDEPSDSLIEFGTTPDLGSSEARAELVFNHNIPLTGLAAGTNYYFRVSSKDAADNGKASETYAFTTDPQPGNRQAVITQAPAVVGTTDTTATIYWETDLPSDTVVTYGEGSTLTSQVADGAKVNRHQATITNLQPNATYSLVVSSTDMEGNTVLAKAGRPVTFLASSDPYGFTPTVGVLTSSLPDTTPPVISNQPVVSGIGSTSATITWSTDEISDSLVFFGLSTIALDRSAGEIRPVKSHALAITNLQPSTTYYLKATSTDPSGNGPTASGIISFTTAPLDVTPPTITTFTAPASSATRTVSGITFTASDASGIAGYCLTDVNDAAGCVWLGMAPTGYALKDGSAAGSYTLYAFAKDTAGNISSAVTGAIVYGGVNGVCGSSSGATLTAAPTTNLCAAGTPSAVTGSGPWSWTCAGSPGYTTASCSVQIQTWPLTVLFAGTGGGSVSGGMSCVSGSSCPPVAFTHGAPVTLTATPNTFSTFDGWAGACAGTGSCLLTMNSAKNVTATFTAATKAKVGTKGFTTLQAAYDDPATTTGSIIKLLEGPLTGSFTAVRGVAVKLEGGYSASYDTMSTETSIQGPVKIRGGAVRMRGITVR